MADDRTYRRGRTASQYRRDSDGPPLSSLGFDADNKHISHTGATMKRVLAIILAGGILTLAMQLEIFARGGGGGGRGGGGGVAVDARWRRWGLRVPAEGFLPRRERSRPASRSELLGRAQAAVSSPLLRASHSGRAKAVLDSCRSTCRRSHSAHKRRPGLAAAHRPRRRGRTAPGGRQRSGESSLPGAVQRLVS